MKWAALVVCCLCMLSGSASAAGFLGGPPVAGERPSRFVRVEGISVGGLYETRDDIGAISGRFATVTCVLGRARVGVTGLDGFGRPHSMNEGHSIIEMLGTVQAGFNLLSGPDAKWRVCGMVPEVYGEAVVALQNQSDAQYKPSPNGRLALCGGVASHGVGVRASLGYMVGRDALFAGLEVRALTFDFGF